jgi:hypothetical protein
LFRFFLWSFKIRAQYRFAKFGADAIRAQIQHLEAAAHDECAQVLCSRGVGQLVARKVQLFDGGRCKC